MNPWRKPTSAEIDAVLTRFDESSPSLQRRVVVKMATDLLWSEQCRAELVAALKSLLRLQPQERGSIEVECDLEALLAKAKAARP